MPRALPATLIVALVGLATGCANQVGTAPDVLTPASPSGAQNVIRKGVRFSVPGSWLVAPQDGDRQALVFSGTAMIAVWRYDREEPLPSDRTALAQAREALVERVRTRDPSFVLDAASLERFDDQPAIELRGHQTVGERRVRVRSLHVFFAASETVIDAYAPPAVFGRIEREVLEPMLASLDLVDER